MKQRNYLLALLISLSIVLSCPVFAETIVVGAGNESQIYGDQNETVADSLTESEALMSDLKTILNDLKATTDEKAYLEALNARDKEQEKKIDRIIRSMDKITRSQLNVIKEQTTTIEHLREELSVSEETLTSRMTSMEVEMEKQKLYKYFGMMAVAVLTVFIMEYAQALTRRKRLYFKLRKIRDEFPINPGVLFGIFSVYMIGQAQACPDKCEEIEKIDNETGNVTTSEYCTQRDCTTFSYMGYFGLAFVVGCALYLFLRDRRRQKIPFDKIKRAYITEMETKENISINPFALNFKLTEEGDRYVFVLKDIVDDIPTYYMCEADMYEGTWGRGFGQFTTKESEAMYWFQTRKKLDIQKVMYDELQKQTLREMHLKTKEQQHRMSRMDGQTEEFTK